MRSHAYNASGEVRHGDADFPSEDFQYVSAEVQKKAVSCEKGGTT